MTSILKHYVVPVVSPHTLTHKHSSGLFLEENPREYFTYDLKESFILSGEAYAALSR